MIKDPLTRWEGGEFPYEALAEAGVAPESGMRQVIDAAGELIERGLWSPEKRAAWDELRTVERRLWVDFFMHAAPARGLVAALVDACARAELTLPPLDLSRLLRLDFADLLRPEEDSREVAAEAPELGPLAEFDLSPEAVLGELESET